MMADDDLTLVVNGTSLEGWQDVSVTLGIERMPNSFDITLTEKYPGQANAVSFFAGDPCEVYLGSDHVITGYIDRYNPRITADDHTIHAVGRSKSADMVDCSAEWPGGQIKGSTAQSIGQKLADPYGIKIVAADGVDVGPPIPQFNLTLGESPFAILERICRYRGLLMVDQPDGSILLTRAGAGEMTSGVAEGANGQVIEGNYSADERFSDYEAFLQSIATTEDAGTGGNLLWRATDTGMKRHRQRDIIAEAGGGGQDVAKLRATWECNRRAGRSYQLNWRVDSWRDKGGGLWLPNYSIPVKAPSIKAPPYDWLIGEVTFNKGEQGTSADLLIMPKQAFLPEPILLQPFAADVGAQQ